MPFTRKHPIPPKPKPLSGFFKFVGLKVKEYDLSYSEKRDMLNTLVRSAYPADLPAIVDLGDAWLVFETVKGALYRVTYSIDASGLPVLAGQAEKVRRLDVYIPVGTDLNKALASMQTGSQEIQNQALSQISELKKMLQGGA